MSGDTSEQQGRVVTDLDQLIWRFHPSMNGHFTFDTKP
jgi:hypothetical protein